MSFTDQALPELPEVRVITPRLFRDDRGEFFESWHSGKFSDLGLDFEFVQDNHSISGRGVLRGLHYQVPPGGQAKLVRVVVGEVFDVAVDIRRSSETFGRWAARRLSAANREMLWIPQGFAHGFLTLTEGAEVVYKCSAHYDRELDRTLAWNDPDLGIDWPLADGARPELSGKDASASGLREAELFP